MITGFIINVFYVLLYNLLLIFPVGILPADISSAFSTMLGFIVAFSFFFNLPAIKAALVFVVGFEILVIGTQIVLWLVRTIRGS